MTTAGADEGARLVIVGVDAYLDGLWERYNVAARVRHHRLRSLLSVLTDTVRFHEYLESQPDGAASELRATIARTAERDTRLPQATAPSMHGARDPFRMVDSAEFAEEARRLADSMCALIALIRADLAKALVPVDYAYVDTVPRNDRSPCGVVRLTTPTIPRAPGRPNSPSITTRWGVSAARPQGEAQAA
ncbi:hypothetical protein [Streptomyces sp. RK9]|uniref:hypothetical protein n=1 Tax=Streptomyces sp. RK9 TaxID=3239284 RepID=UPI00386ACD0A